MVDPNGPRLDPGSDVQREADTLCPDARRCGFASLVGEFDCLAGRAERARREHPAGELFDPASISRGRAGAIDPSVEGIAGSQLSQAPAESIGKSLCNALLHEQANARAAYPTALKSDGACQALDSTLHVRVVKDEKRRLAAHHVQDESLAGAGGPLPDGSARLCRSRQRDQVDLFVVCDPLAR